MLGDQPLDRGDLGIEELNVADPRVDGLALLERQLVAIGPRPSGSPAIEHTRKYIKDQLTGVGLTAAEQTWEDQTPIDRIRLVNLVATIPGARKERIVFAGHYDTKLYREFRFVGASDGDLSLGQLLGAIAALLQRDEADLHQTYLPVVRELVGEGFLVLD